MKYAQHRIKVDLASYRHYWRGVKKIGKSTFFRDLVKEAYGDYKYGLMIAPGNESGFSALDGIYAVEAKTWKDFVEIVDDLVENKGDNEFKLIAIDTVDELVAIASDYALQVHYRRKQERVETLNAALGGYGAGHKFVGDVINDQIKRLEGAGYGLVFIGHTTIRNIKEKNMEEGYQSLTSNLDSRFDSIFTDKADLICSFYNVRNVQDKTLLGTERLIYYRTDGFVEAGGRFKEMPLHTPMTPKDYLTAFEQGVRSSFVSPVEESEIEKLRSVEVAKREKESAEFIQSQKNLQNDENETLETVEDYRRAIKAVISSFSPEMQKQMKAELKEVGIPVGYQTIEDVEVLKRFLRLVSR